MKTRVVLSLTDIELARLAGMAAGARLSIPDLIKRELLLTDEAIKLHDYLNRCADTCESM